MFEFCSNFHRPTEFMSNPFGMGFAASNPHLDFYLGLSAGLMGVPLFTMPMMPTMNFPIFGGFGFNNYNFCNANYTPMFTPQYNFSSFNSANNYNCNFNYNAGSSFSTLNNFSAIQTPDVTSYMSALTKSVANVKSPFASITSASNPISSTKGIKISKNSKDYGPEFLAKVKKIAKNINCDYKDLLAVMNSESGINAAQWCTVKGEEGKAVGLIQFRASTAKTLGTSLDALSKMKPIDQLDYVEKYFKHWISIKGLTGKKLTAGDVYALVYTPAHVNKEVLATSGDRFYKKNKGLDVNNDGKITKSDLAQQLRNKDVSDNSFMA
jgi:hypothetical protein